MSNTKRARKTQKKQVTAVKIAQKKSQNSKNGQNTRTRIKNKA